MAIGDLFRAKHKHSNPEVRAEAVITARVAPGVIFGNFHFPGEQNVFADITWVETQRSRWGSCSPDDRTIRLSLTLADYPGWVRDYVIVHELAHLLVADHSKRFWELVERYPLTERARGFLIAKGMEEG